MTKQSVNPANTIDCFVSLAKTYGLFLFSDRLLRGNDNYKGTLPKKRLFIIGSNQVQITMDYKQYNSKNYRNQELFSALGRLLMRRFLIFIAFLESSVFASEAKQSCNIYVINEIASSLRSSRRRL